MLSLQSRYAFVDCMSFRNQTNRMLRAATLKAQTEAGWTNIDTHKHKHN